MERLCKIINEGLDEKLSNEETFSLVSYYSRIQDYKKKCVYVRTIIEAMNNKIINCDAFLTFAITQCQDTDGIILVAIAMRFGANPNLYVVMKDVGILHIMVYTVMYLRDKVDNDVIILILCVLSVLGSSHRSPITQFQKKQKNNNYLDNVNSTVGEWLYQNGFYDFSDTKNFIKENFSEDDQINLGAICDDIEIAFPKGMNMNVVIEVVNEDGYLENISDEEAVPAPDLSQVLLYNSYKVQERIPLTYRMEKGECLELRMCVETGGLEMFKYLFNKGYKFTYFGLNRLLVILKSTVGKDAAGNTILSNKVFNLIYADMLKFCVNKGVIVDKEQFEILQVYTNSLSDDIEEIYSKPMWIKSCSASENVPLPEVVKELAFSLNLVEEGMENFKGNNKVKICNNLEKINKLNADQIIQANSNIQEDYMSSEMYNISDYAKNTNKVKCSNPINGNPLDYHKNTLVHYRDENNKIWCFTPNVFENLITEPVNMYNNKKIPLSVVNKMQHITMFLKRLGIDPKNITTVSKAVDKLKAPDAITNDNTNKAINFVINAGQIRGVYKDDLLKMPVELMIQIMSMINYDQDYLPVLTPSHRLATFCKAIYVYYNKYTDMEIMENGMPTLDDIFNMI